MARLVDQTGVTVFEGVIESDDPGPDFARVQRSTGIAPWDGSTLPFDVVSVDAAALWDAANHQFVAKRAGWYAVSAYANGSGNPGGVAVDAQATDGYMVVEVVVFGAGDNIQAVVGEHAAVLSGKWIAPPLYGHTELAVGDQVVVQGTGGDVPAGFTFAIYGPLA